MVEFTNARLTLPEGGRQERFQVSASVAALRKAPEPSAEMVSQVLFGETVRLHHEEGEFGLIQSESDRYCGWVTMDALSKPVLEPTHRIHVARLHAYAEPSIRAAPRFVLGLGAKLTATGDVDGKYTRFERAGWVHSDLVSPIDQLETDPAGVARRFLGTPYLWGGRDCLGIDCSGLPQVAFDACGIRLPRDSDMQEAWCGRPIEDWQSPGALRRNDLIFWKGHIGIMLDAEQFLHANAYHMMTAIEPIGTAIERIASMYDAPTSARRLDLTAEIGRLPDWLTLPG